MAPITIIQGDAGEQSYNDITLVFLYNPFGEATMRRTVQRIGLSFHQRPRPMKLVCVNPEHENVLAEQPWLSKIDSFFLLTRIHSALPNSSLATSVWRSTGYEGV